MKDKVIFRIWKGEVIALFPEERERDGSVTSYMHIGQHSGADYDYIIRHSRPATEKKYKLLYKELVQVGYNMQVCKRRGKL